MIRTVGLLLLLLVFGVFTCGATIDRRAPLVLRKFQISIVDAASRRARIVLAGKALGPGMVDLHLRLPWSQDGGALVAGATTSSERVEAGDSVVRIWDVTLPPDGYHRIAEVEVGYNADAAARGHFVGSDLFSLYAEVRNGIITSSSIGPDPRFCQAPTMLKAASLRPVRKRGRAAVSAHTITISISGRIQALDINGLEKGVPGVEVQFDWDNDNDPNTSVHPVYDHGGSAFTDEDGNYTFNADFASDYNASDYSDHIRVWAYNANDAAYDAGLGSTAVFVGPFATLNIDISTATDQVVATGRDLEVDREQGMALRYIHRAFVSAKRELQQAPPRIGYHVQHNMDRTSFFCKTGDCSSPIPDLSEPRIVFTTRPYSTLAYHEYGHYVEYNFHGDDMPLTSGQPHWWELNTDNGTAWTEGWAEFFAAMVHGDWYYRTLPVVRDDDADDTQYQFPDSGEDFFGAGGNREHVEGAIAVFLYSLWDDIHQRLQGDVTSQHVVYEGDNEDLGNPYGYGPDVMNAVAHIHDGDGRGQSYIRSYKDNGFLPAVKVRYPITYLYHLISIDDKFNQLMTTGTARPATATDLTVAIDPVSGGRKLNWKDNTEPSSIDYETESTGPHWIDFSSNEEQAFYIFRKEVRQEPWKWDGRDGRLDHDYQVIGYGNQNATEYIDTDPLPDGLYSYVVVAVVNNIKLSIPKTEASIRIHKGITIKKEGSDDCTPVTVIRPGTGARFIASSSLTSPTFHWIASNKPGYITLSGVNSDTLTVTNNYLSGSAQIMPPFALRCVATYSTGADTSLPVYPAYTPLDAAGMFVSIRTSSGFIPDTDATRGLEFLTQQNEQIINIYPLIAKPSRDSSGYVVLVKGLPAGTTTYEYGKLFVIDHPTGTEVRGSSRCGFTMYVPDGVGFVEDTVHRYGMREVPLKSAYHSRLGIVSDYLMDFDSLSMEVETGDSLYLAFNDSTLAGNSSGGTGDSGSVRDYFLELAGTFAAGSENATSIGGTAAISMNEFTRPARGEYRFDESRPNPAGASTTVQYQLGDDAYTHLTLCDAAGRVVDVPVDEYQKRGVYELTLDVSHLPIGAYYLRIISGSWSAAQMLTIVR